MPLLKKGPDVLLSTAPIGKKTRAFAPGGAWAKMGARATLFLTNVMNYRKHGAAAARFAERRRREDDAPRLCDQVPGLLSLRLDIEERSGIAGTQPKHIRRFVVDRAPALFLVPCGDPRCVDGEHDLTTLIMRALRAHETSFQGTDECTGSLGPSPCDRVLHFDAIAEYADAPLGP